ncbi:MAG: hypothetical protein PVJ49_04165 [Acidobacteriota bacterium]|jgi:hypothetical protein
MSAAHGDVLLDAHVHYHAGFSRDAFFHAATRNLRTGGLLIGVREPLVVGLMFTESAGVDAFAGFAAEAAGGPPATQPERPLADASDWSFRATAEHNSLWAVHNDGDGEVLVIAGRQLVTREKLEVLALGCREALPDGMTLRAARDAVLAAGAVPVVPWGFGKWWASRGRVVREMIEADSPGRWYLGDNAGRPRASRRPPLFASAARRHVFVLPGSDPLPLPFQEAKAGRCGFAMPGPLDEQRPAATVLEWLRACDTQPPTFGRYESLTRFARDQVAMQLRRAGDPGTQEAEDGEVAGTRDAPSEETRS